MSRKDFSRKANSYVPVVLNDSYSKFRFQKRANEILSPLSKTKFGFTVRSNLRKMSVGMHDMNRTTYQKLGSGSRFTNEKGMGNSMNATSRQSKHMTEYARLGQKSYRNASPEGEHAFSMANKNPKSMARRTSHPQNATSGIEGKNVENLFKTFD